MTDNNIHEQTSLGMGDGTAEDGRFTCNIWRLVTSSRPAPTAGPETMEVVHQ
ncbi:unnamed protein product [Leuciscus chuanchicus]